MFVCLFFGFQMPKRKESFELLQINGYLWNMMSVIQTFPSPAKHFQMISNFIVFKIFWSKDDFLVTHELALTLKQYYQALWIYARLKQWMV